MDEFDALDRFLAQQEAEDLFSGTVVIERSGTTVFEGAYGYAHLGLRVRNELQTRFNLGSITKMFTAVAILQLVEQGKLSLDSTVDRWLPDTKIGAADRMTVHHLLCHQSGLGRYWNEKCRQRRSSLRTTAAYLELIEGEQPAFEPGSATAYGNSAYLLLGGIIERASGQDYYEYIRQHVCIPAGMARAAHLELDQVVDFAHGYTYIEWEGPDHPEYRTDNIFQYPVRGNAAGFLYSSGPELIKFGQALRRFELITSDSVAAMQRSYESGSDGMGLGYGCQRIPYSRGVAIGHGGRAFGAATMLLLLPEVDTSVSILSNYDRPADKRVFEEFDRMLANR